MCAHAALPSNQPSQNMEWCTSHKPGERILKGSDGGAVRFNSCPAVRMRLQHLSSTLVYLFFGKQEDEINKKLGTYIFGMNIAV